MLEVAGSAVLFFGLLLPWLVLLAVVVAVPLVLIRWTHRRSNRAPAAEPEAQTDADR
jgi:hypothetical protein